MSEEKNSEVKNEDNGNKINLWMVIAIIALAVIAVGLIVVVADALTTDESEGSGPPVEDPSTPVPGEPQVTASTNVNVRAGPGTQYDVYGILPAGAAATVLAACQDYSWWAIEVPVETGHGWVSGDFVVASNTDTVPLVECSNDAEPVPPAEPGQPSVTATALLNVRSGPSTNYPSYGLLHPGQSALATAKTINPEGELWYQISLPPAPDGFGWVSGNYVTVTGDDQIPSIEYQE